MKRMPLVSVVIILLGVGCQSSCPTACAPKQKPPLGQRLFGTTQKPSNCPTCPPPGALPGPQPPVISSQTPFTGTTSPVGLTATNPPSISMAPPANMTGPSIGMAPPPAPVTANKAPLPAGVVLGPPETNAPPSRTNRPTTQPGFPVDIPSYAVLSEKIAGGHQPFPDGISWLKEAGFSTVIHLRSNTDDVVASRQLVERQGLAYKSMEVSPQGLDTALLTTIDNDIQSANGRPVFIFDRDGSRTGAIWIVYATKYLAISESQAREQAARLGYRKESADPSWETAISKMISSR